MAARLRVGAHEQRTGSPAGSPWWTPGRRHADFGRIPEPAEESKPWEYAVDVDGALVWTDEP